LSGRVTLLEVIDESDLFIVQGTIDTDQYIQNIDRLGFISTLDQKHGPFGWIFQQDGAPSHTSQVALDWLEESLDLIVGWPANLPDLSLIELLWAILEKLIRKIKPSTIEELNNTLIAMGALIPQSTIDKLCEGLQGRLELCLANGGESISNQPWRLTETHATNNFLLYDSVNHIPWIADEGDRLMQRYLAIEPRWKLLETQ
jgi:transposase